MTGPLVLFAAALLLMGIAAFIWFAAILTWRAVRGRRP